MAADDGRRETEKQRLDRNFDELQSELRVVVTGVQVLFAFLLIVPFNTGFKAVGTFERAVYFVALVFAALSAVLMIAPAAQHRFLFRENDKRHIVWSANRSTIVGLVCLAFAMCGSILLVTTKLFGIPAGVVTTALVSVPFAALWFALPLWRRRNLNRQEERRSDRNGQTKQPPDVWSWEEPTVS
jgi:amino acid transporter